MFFSIAFSWDWKRSRLRVEESSSRKLLFPHHLRLRSDRGCQKSAKSCMIYLFQARSLSKTVLLFNWQPFCSSFKFRRENGNMTFFTSKLCTFPMLAEVAINNPRWQFLLTPAFLRTTASFGFFFLFLFSSSADVEGIFCLHELREAETMWFMSLFQKLYTLSGGERNPNWWIGGKT